MRLLNSLLIVSLLVLTGCTSRDRPRCSIFTSRLQTNPCCSTNRPVIRQGGILQRRVATRSQVISVVSGPCACELVQDPGQDLISEFSNNFNDEHSSDRFSPYVSPSRSLMVKPKQANPVIAGVFEKGNQDHAGSLTPKKPSKHEPDLIVEDDIHTDFPTTEDSNKPNQVKPLISVPVVNPDEFKGTSILLPNSQSVDSQSVDSQSVDSQSVDSQSVQLESAIEPDTELLNSFNTIDASTDPEELVATPIVGSEVEDLGSPTRLQAIPASTSRITTEYYTEPEPVLLDEATPTPHTAPEENIELLEPVSTQLPAEVDNRQDTIVLKAIQPERRANKKIVPAIEPANQKPVRVAKRIVHTDHVDRFGLPTSPTVDFKELPPVGPHQFRPLNLQRSELDDQKVNSIPNIDINGESLKPKTQNHPSQLESPEVAPSVDLQTSGDASIPIQIGHGLQNISADPASVGIPKTRETMLRMRAIPAKRKSDDLPAVATIKLNDIRYVESDLKKLDHKELQQATRKVIAPKNRAKILDR